MDRTAMSHNDTAHNGKTQTGSVFLVCDEGLEDGFLILRRDAGSHCHGLPAASVCCG